MTTETTVITAELRTWITQILPSTSLYRGYLLGLCDRMDALFDDSITDAINTATAALQHLCLRLGLDADDVPINANDTIVEDNGLGQVISKVTKIIWAGDHWEYLLTEQGGNTRTEVDTAEFRSRVRHYVPDVIDLLGAYRDSISSALQSYLNGDITVEALNAIYEQLDTEYAELLRPTGGE